MPYSITPDRISQFTEILGSNPSGPRHLRVLAIKDEKVMGVFHRRRQSCSASSPNRKMIRRNPHAGYSLLTHRYSTKSNHSLSMTENNKNNLSIRKSSFISTSNRSNGSPYNAVIYSHFTLYPYSGNADWR